MVKSIYCTVLNAAFVPRALVLQQSIARYSPNACFGFYCVDGDAAILLQKHAAPNVFVVRPDDYETAELRAARSRLRLNEYCWMCKPAILQHALASAPWLEWSVWLDSDMLAFADVDSELERHPAASVILTPHRFSLPEFAAYEPIVGYFNAGYAAFRNVSEGIAALDWWMNRCLESCPAQPTADACGDQKYLNQMPKLFPNVVSSGSLGLNCAPWNVFEKRIESSGGQISVNNHPLLLYHFQGFKIVRSWAFDLYGGMQRLPERVREFIYSPYVEMLAPNIQEVAREIGDPWACLDKEYIGFRGIVTAVRRLRRYPNLYMSW